MNGPEHYEAAERLLNEIKGSTPVTTANVYTAAAQVHATLALAAATVEASDRIVVTSPSGGDPNGIDPPEPGSPWGRALYPLPEE